MRRPLPQPLAAVAVGASACAALAVFGAGAVPAGSASAPARSAQSQYEDAVKAATNQTVHFQTDVTQGKVTLQQSGDAGTTSGSESITIHNGKSTELMDAEVVGTNGYVKGNTTGLEDILSLTPTQARKYQGQWLSFPMSNSNLAQLVGGLLKSQVATELGFSGPFTHVADAIVNGQNAIGIRGSVSTSNGTSVPEVLYVPSSGKPLPIEEVTNPGANVHATTAHGTVSFSNWGEHVEVPAPAHSVPLSKLAPTSTSGATTTPGG